MDFRKGIDGLALAVQEVIGLDPFSGAAFVFRAKQKRLEGAEFVWCDEDVAGSAVGPVRGTDWRLVRPERVRRPELTG